MTPMAEMTGLGQTWLNYGGGVNSTALAVLVETGTLSQYSHCRYVWSDTKDEEDETYAYIERVFRPWLRKHGKELEVVSGKEGVLERWQRLAVVGSRTLRPCTDYAKIQPIEQHVKTAAFWALSVERRADYLITAANTLLKWPSFLKYGAGEIGDAEAVIDWLSEPATDDQMAAASMLNRLAMGLCIKEAGVVQLLGIDSDQPHRARPSREGDIALKAYPLINLGIDRKGCERIIAEAGLCVPPKSGCWHCPFKRKSEVIKLALERPERFQKIIDLEAASIAKHPVPVRPDAPDNFNPRPDEFVDRFDFEQALQQIDQYLEWTPKVRAQWNGRPAVEWLKMAKDQALQATMFDDEIMTAPPCGCYDG
jgi:3'-phosphoadenosine 5'-phosphosulfate sulfotransferase (PAPS reductase)/FAD synthetase